MKTATWSAWRIFGTGLVIAGLLTGCGSGGTRDGSGQQISDVYGTFSKGEIRLRCGLSCAGAAGLNRNHWAELYKHKAWRDLALSVADVNLESDHEYFYLGRAAEGLGFYQAADTYYRLARASSYECDSFTCKDVKVAAEIAQGLARVAPVLASTALAPPTPKNAPASMIKPAQTLLTSPATSARQEDSSERKVTVTHMENGNTVYSEEIDFKSDHKGDWGGGNVSLTAAGRPGTMGYGLLIMIGYVSPHSYSYRFARNEYDQLLDYQLIFDKTISCNGSKCARNEAARIPLPRSYLEGRATTGLKIRLVGKEGDQVIEVPAAAVSHFLTSVP
ncbi:MAG: hypothetical protein WCA48_07880 [Pseudomonas gingeri]